jgi:hypothetical protein
MVQKYNSTELLGLRTTSIVGISIVLLIIVPSVGSLTISGNAEDEENGWVQFRIQNLEKIKKVYYGATDTWNFVISNLNCVQDDAGRARFFFRIYLITDKTKKLLFDESRDPWSLGIGETIIRSFTFPPWTEAKRHQVRIELYWQERLKPVAKRTVPVQVVKVFVNNWNPSAQVFPQGVNKLSNLSISFKNGGNDHMYNVSIVVADFGGLGITPQLQSLETIEPEETKTVIFHVDLSKPEEKRRIYNPRFEIIYYDFRGIAHKEEYIATVKIIENPLVYNLISVLGAIALITAIGTFTLFIALIIKR